jgi:hypothetical protein
MDRTVPPRHSAGASIREVRHVGNGRKADRAYGEGVAKAMGRPLSEVKEKP